MKYAVISDIHANLQALDTVLADAKANGAEEIVCLGDIVGYGPLPGETLDRVRTRASVVIAGNHDDAVSGRISAKAFIDLAADAVQRHREELAQTDLDWLRNLPYTARIDGAIAAHGEFTNPQAFRYMMDADTVSANFKATVEKLLFVGHTHVPCVYLVGKSGKLYRIDPEDFTLEDHKRYIVNPGSVGYPREGNGQCYSSYVLYDSTARTIQFRMLPFAVSGVMQHGRNSRTARRRIVIATAVAAALASGLLSFFLPSRGEKIVEREIVVERMAYDADPELVMTNRSLTLPRSARNVRAGLKLERGSAAIDLCVVFKAADGSALKTHCFETKGSANRQIKVPINAISADFIVRRQKPGENPKIKSFNPRWE